jgi:CRP/FNR family transcriptional regulator, cyclic AMP receptor protein
MVMIEDLCDCFNQIDLFRGLGKEDLRAIIQMGDLRELARDSALFVEGEPCRGVFLLLKGQVQLCKLSPAGEVSVLEVFYPVALFNEVPALDGGSNPATAVTVQNSLVWHASPEIFQVLMFRFPSVGVGLLKVMAARSRSTVMHFEDQSFRSVLARTARLLLEISNNGQKDINRRKYPNTFMAARITAAPEAFSRSLTAFKKNGWIACTPVWIHILRPDEVIRAAQVGPVLD